jgi:hypothetical protein
MRAGRERLLHEYGHEVEGRRIKSLLLHCACVDRAPASRFLRRGRRDPPSLSPPAAGAVSMRQPSLCKRTQTDSLAQDILSDPFGQILYSALNAA